MRDSESKISLTVKMQSSFLFYFNHLHNDVSLIAFRMLNEKRTKKLLI